MAESNSEMPKETIYTTSRGESATAKEWADKLGFTVNHFRKRVRTIGIDKAVSQPKKIGNPKAYKVSGIVRPLIHWERWCGATRQAIGARANSLMGKEGIPREKAIEKAVLHFRKRKEKKEGESLAEWTLFGQTLPAEQWAKSVRATPDEVHKRAYRERERNKTLSKERSMELALEYFDKRRKERMAL